MSEFPTKIAANVPGVRVASREKIAEEKTSPPDRERDILPADRERLFWLGIRQGLLIFLATIEKFKVRVKSERCETCGKVL